MGRGGAREELILPAATGTGEAQVRGLEAANSEENVLFLCSDRFSVLLLIAIRHRGQGSLSSHYLNLKTAQSAVVGRAAGELQVGRSKLVLEKGQGGKDKTLLVPNTLAFRFLTKTVSRLDGEDWGL